MSTDKEQRLEKTKDWKQRIDAVCENLGWSLSEFCRKAGVNKGVVSRIINQTAPTADTIRKVETALQKAEKK